MTTRTALTIALLAAPLGLAACGDADDPVMDAEEMPMDQTPMDE